MAVATAPQIQSVHASGAGADAASRAAIAPDPIVSEGWVAVSRELFEYTMRPWMGRRYEGWLRAWVRPHPIDLRGQVLVPPHIYGVFKKRPTYSRVTKAELAGAGYPELPRAERTKAFIHSGRGGAVET